MYVKLIFVAGIATLDCRQTALTRPAGDRRTRHRSYWYWRWSRLDSQALNRQVHLNPPKLDGVAAWWGQSGGGLEDVCKQDGFSTIIISFLNKCFANGTLPGMNLAGAVNGPSQAQVQAGATDLPDGVTLGSAIKHCQSSGKKVFISLGGQAATQNLTNDVQGATLADNMWNLFLGGLDSYVSALSPFGDAVLDGVDMDIESEDSTGWNGLFEQMRINFNQDTKKHYYILAAPQCPRQHYSADGEPLPVTGDLSLSDEVLQKTDITWVQFYNNPGCNHGDAGFIDAVTTWSHVIFPSQIWIGAPGGPTNRSALNGFAALQELTKEMEQIKNLSLPNLGGWALSDAITAMNNSNHQEAVWTALKEDLETISAAASGPSATVILASLAMVFSLISLAVSCLQTAMQKRGQVAVVRDEKPSSRHRTTLMGDHFCVASSRYFRRGWHYMLHRWLVHHQEHSDAASDDTSDFRYIDVARHESGQVYFMC